MEIISTVALISINETLLVQLISFLIFLFLLNRIMIRPLRATMEERDFHIENLEKDIVEAAQKAREVARQVQGQEIAVRESAMSLRREHEQEGNTEAARLFEETRQEMLRVRQKAEAEIADQMEAARHQIQAESEALAVAMMERALDRKVST